MIIKESIRKVVETVVEVRCDICGESCKKQYKTESLDMVVHWGYESDKDGQTWSAQICEACVDKHLAPLIKFNIKEHI